MTVLVVKPGIIVQEKHSHRLRLYDASGSHDFDSTDSSWYNPNRNRGFHRESLSIPEGEIRIRDGQLVVLQAVSPKARNPHAMSFPVFPAIGLMLLSELTRLVLILSGLSFMILSAMAQSNYSTAYTFITLAGYPVRGSADSIGGSAQFSLPQGVAADSAGTIYVADTGNNTIRKLTPAGEVSTIAGFAGSRGATDGIGAAARFTELQSIAADTNGNL